MPLDVGLDENDEALSLSPNGIITLSTLSIVSDGIRSSYALDLLREPDAIRRGILCQTQLNLRLSDSRRVHYTIILSSG